MDPEFLGDLGCGPVVASQRKKIQIEGCCVVPQNFRGLAFGSTVTSTTCDLWALAPSMVRTSTARLSPVGHTSGTLREDEKQREEATTEVFQRASASLGIDERKATAEIGAGQVDAVELWCEGLAPRQRCKRRAYAHANTDPPAHPYSVRFIGSLPWIRQRFVPSGRASADWALPAADR